MEELYRVEVPNTVSVADAKEIVRRMNEREARLHPALRRLWKVIVQGGWVISKDTCTSGSEMRYTIYEPSTS